MNAVLPNFAVAPPLPRRFQAPAGLRWGTFQAHDGASLRWAALAPPHTRATCVLVGGFAEFAEKYFETMSDLATRGLAVWFLDWRGQGGSIRPANDPTRPLARDFARDASDLADFAAAHLPNDQPRFLIAHSMGAAIGLLSVALRPGVFDAAVLSAPMLAIKTDPVPSWLSPLFAAAATGLGFGRAFAPGRGRWTADPDIAQHSVTSHDPVRAGLEQAWFLAQPQLRVDGATYGWVDAVFGLIQRLAQPTLLQGVATPMLIGCPAQEFFVVPAASRRAAEFLPQCTCVPFDSARHELFMETDDIRNRWLTAIDDFLTPLVAAPKQRMQA